MLGFKINNEDLEIAPGTVLEIERNNPYLQFNEEIVGEFSLPFEFPATPQNIRLSKYAPLLQKRVGEGITAMCYDNGFQDSVGKLKVEKAFSNQNRRQSGKISAYYLTGLSYFNSDIKDKRLRAVNCGGNRTFPIDSSAWNGTGFWGHIHKVIAAPAGYGASGYDYAFYPVINKDFNWDSGTTAGIACGGEIMNHMAYTGGVLHFTQPNSDVTDANTIVPFPYLKYVLERIEAHIGWKFKGAILDDPEFLKITLLNTRAIDWAYFVPVRLIVLGGSAFRPRQTATFNIADHLPDVSIAEFLLALRNRLGLSFDVDKKSRVVEFKKLVEVAASDIKEMTGKASPVITKTILTEKKIYSLKTLEGSGAINLKGVAYQGVLASLSNLPPAAESRYLHVYLVAPENNYYICEQKEDADIWEWHLFDANIRDVEPEGAKEEIVTAALTAGSEKFSSYLDLLPRWDEMGFWPGRTEDSGSISIALLFYHGVRVNKSGQPYPFASHHIYDSAGVQVGSWSLSFLGKKKDGTEVGLYALNWRSFLDKLTTGEEMAVTLYLSRAEFMQLRFSDVISIAGVRMYVSKMKHTIPYNGIVECECTRI